MRVALFRPQLAIGGSERQLFLLAQGLPEEGFEPIVVTLESRDGVAERFASVGLTPVVLPRRAPLGLVLKVDKPAGWKDEGRVVGDAVRDHFAREAIYTRRRLRTLLRRGWVSLVIGLAFLAVVATAVTYIGRVSTGPLTAVLRESLLIGGWVAMWRPLETFLYDWWPIRGELRLHERLSRMAVRIEYMGVRNG